MTDEASSAENLEELVASGKFREDLLARLSGLRIELPSLRDRREDLGVLLASMNTGDKQLSRDAARALFHYDWPQNIRELHSRLTTATALVEGKLIDVDDLSLPATAPATAAPRPRTPLSDADRALRDEILALLKEHGGNISAVAEAKGKARSQIHRWLRRFEIDASQFRGTS